MSSNQNNNSYIDSAASSARSAIDTLTGNQQAGNHPDDKENLPSGTYNQTVGSAKQSVGAAIGNENLRRDGASQTARGEEEEARKQVHEWGNSVGDRVKGKVGEFVSGPGFGGDEEQRLKEEKERMKYKDLHDQGKMRQKGVEAEIDQRWGDERERKY